MFVEIRRDERMWRWDILRGYLRLWRLYMAFPMSNRIEKKGEASPLEQQVASALNEVAASSEEAMKKSLANLKITGAKEVEANGLKVVIVTVPYKQIASYRQVSGYLVGEVEKKLPGAQVVIVAKRRAFPKTCEHGRRYRAIRPNGRTLRAVNEALLEDVAYPTAIVSKRIHYDLKGGQTTHVFLDPNDKTRVEDRLGGFAIAYERLTGLKTVFEVPAH